MVVEVAAVAFWAMGPAYLPNNAAVVLGGGRPLDGGRTWGGQRVLGDGKTWRGTIGGTLAGALVAAGLNGVRPIVATASGLDLPPFTVTAALTLAFGAMAGDIVASLVKRRAGFARGRAVPGLDQLDFVFGALGVTALVAPGWFATTFTPPVLLAVLLLTPVLHIVTNLLAYQVGVKDEPW